MRHEFRDEARSTREEFSEYDGRREAKQRDKERGQARKVKNAFRQSVNAAPKVGRRG